MHGKTRVDLSVGCFQRHSEEFLRISCNKKLDFLNDAVLNLLFGAEKDIFFCCLFHDKNRKKSCYRDKRYNCSLFLILSTSGW